MIHIRQRYAITALKKKLKLAPVLFIQGARQVGKSYLARELFANKNKNADYVSLDNSTHQNLAKSSPETFIQNYKNNACLVIDEAQKAPPLFDTIKDLVEVKRRPGEFVLLGSTEFSHLTKVRESLTGRASRIRIYPLTLSEIKHFPLKKTYFLNAARCTRKDVLQFLGRGGMPGIFAVREDEERLIKISDWLQLTCQRDIHQIKKFRLDPEISYRLLEGVARLDWANESTLAKYVGADLRVIKNHLLGLEALFVLNRLHCYHKATGKSSYFLLDTALCDFFQASIDKKIKTFIVHELMSQASYTGDFRTRFSYYHTPRGSIVDVVLDHGRNSLTAIKILSKEHITELDLRSMESFAKKYTIEDRKINLIILAPVSEIINMKGVKIYPWESVS